MLRTLQLQLSLHLSYWVVVLLVVSFFIENTEKNMVTTATVNINQILGNFDRPFIVILG